ncbi:CASP8 and FADD-like apoptosis regulator isoform X1 [Oncorhynchus tshawytscha]|uniref:CASP8 and FADD-like apoptosis regulator isoform X1 n=2 Tax=Oncorhynchus tshawytscha TaxID=74940 RepID=UPI001C3C713A|nr:CASP8 and FADD-like apoptosis regulator isoform X1 [Oncorhynchus tshawytscha]
MQTRVFAEEPDGVRLLMSSMANGELYQMINRICEDLSSGECRRLLYLCGSLDTDRCGSDHVREVLNSWLSRGQVDQLYLVELLFRLRRFDLLKKEFHISKQEVDGILGQNQALSEYRVLMSDVSEDMGTEDLESLKFLLSGSLSRERLTRVKSFLDVIVELEKLDRVSSERVELIEKCLRDISRVDLARKVKGYRNLTSVGTPQHRPVVMTHQAQQQWIRTPSNPMPTASPVSCHSRQEQSTQNTPENENIAEPERKRLFYQSPVDVYRLQSDPRGECLIIDCVGSDGDMLVEMFSGLQFKVTLVKWPRVWDTLSLLRQAAQPRQTQEVDAFACCIISRGTATDLLATDSHRLGVRLDTVRHLFTPDYCPRLAGKPKLFFIQTYSVSGPQDCSSRPTGHPAHREEDLETDGYGEPLSVETVPTDADVFWSHCWTDEGQLEEKDHRSVYLQALREAVQRRRTHLVDVHTEMNRVIFDHNRRNPGARYNINLRHTLRKNLYML